MREAQAVADPSLLRVTLGAEGPSTECTSRPGEVPAREGQQMLSYRACKHPWSLAALALCEGKDVLVLAGPGLPIAREPEQVLGAF